MSDIAARAGVSRPTVSVILNERHDAIGIATETRLRVLAVAEEMGYRRNELARAVKTGKSRTLGFLAGTADLEYAVRALSGATDAAEDLGFSLQRFRINEEGDQTPIVRCVEHRLAGAIVYDPDLHLPFEVIRREFDAHNLPAVWLDLKTPRDWGMGVASDDETGALEAVRHLAHLGHRRIVWVGGIEGVGTGVPRWAGYQKAMRECGTSSHIRAVWTNWQIQTQEQNLREMLAEPEAPTAFLCGSDPLALYLLRFLRSIGKDVPRDVSVVGFGDLRRTDLSDPALTTVRVPYEELGGKAVQLLLESGGPSDVPTSPERNSTLLLTELIVRDSTAPVR